MTAADIWNVGAEFTARDGKKYTIKKPTQYQQGEFQRWLEDRAHAAVDRSRLSEAQKEKQHNLIFADSALGKYEWDGPLALEACWTPAGMAQILTIVCRTEGMSLEKAEEILKDSFREIATKMLLRAAKDPKARADLALKLGELGLPMEWATDLTQSEPNEPSSSSSSAPPSTEPSPNSEASPTTSSASSTTSSAAPMG